MVTGIILYALLATLPMSRETEDGVYHLTSHLIQPVLIFTMLTLAFLKVGIHELLPQRWHFKVLMWQALLFILFSLLAIATDLSDTSLPSGGVGGGLKLLCEGAMLCFICPTATASAVIVGKLGGSVSGCVSYLILCNIMVSVLAPCFLPLVEPHQGLDFLNSFFLIMGKVFPLLIFPLILSQLLRHYASALTQRLLSIPDMAFYMWLVALALAIMVTVRTIVEANIGMTTLIGLAVVSLVCCVVQFILGRRIGRQSALNGLSCRAEKDVLPEALQQVEINAITAGQAMGQKNTVFVIWMGLVFLNPVTSVVGGFYSVWHNVINSWQLYKTRV